MTDDDLANAVIGAFKNGVEVRVITDDECAFANGSDI